MLDLPIPGKQTFVGSATAAHAMCAGLKMGTKFNSYSSNTAPTADRILDAAEELFAERGFAGTAVRDIAAAVDLNPASLYNHFPGKQGLYEAVIDRGLEPVFVVFEKMGKMASEGWSRDIAWDGVDEIINHFAAKPYLAKLVQQDAMAGGENLARLAGRWMAPMLAGEVEMIQQNPKLEGWQAYELPLLMVTLNNLVIGYFANSALLEKLIGTDPLSPDAVTKQREFLHEAIRRLIGGGSGRGSDGSGATGST